ESGYVEGQNLTIDHRLVAGRYDRFPEMAADLIQRRVSVIAAFGSAPAVAAKAATQTLPIVFAVTEDPVSLGLVASLSRPGGNATGLNFFTTEVNAKRLGLLRELVPTAARVALLMNPMNALNTSATLKEVDPAARALGLQNQVFNASTSLEIDAAFTALVAWRPDALFVATDGFFTPGPIGRTGSSPCSSGNLFGTGCCRGRRIDELWSQPHGRVSSGWHFHWPRPQGCEARRIASRAVDEVRTGRQRADRPNARTQHSSLAARYCR